MYVAPFIEIGRYARDARVAAALLDALHAAADTARAVGIDDHLDVLVVATGAVAGLAITEARTDLDRDRLTAAHARIDELARTGAAPAGLRRGRRWPRSPNWPTHWSGPPRSGPAGPVPRPPAPTDSHPAAGGCGEMRRCSGQEPPEQTSRTARRAEQPRWEQTGAGDQPRHHDDPGHHGHGDHRPPPHPCAR